MRSLAKELEPWRVGWSLDGRYRLFWVANCGLVSIKNVIRPIRLRAEIAHRDWIYRALRKRFPK